MRSPTPTFLRTGTTLHATLAASLGAVLLASTGAARADPPPFAARAEGTRVAFSLDLWPTQDALVATMGLSAQIAVHPHFAIDVDVPWAAGNLNEGQPGFSAERTVYGYFGDVTLGGHAVFRVLPEATLSFGATVSIPTRYSFEGAADLSVFAATATASRGFYDAYRFAPQTLSIRFPVGFEARFLRILYYRGELAPDLWVPVGSAAPGDSVQLSLEHADEIEVRAPFGFGGGLRFQAVFLLTNGLSGNGADYAQTALEPFVGYEPPGAGFFARLGMLVALDTPLGFGFDKDKLTTVRMQAGGKF
jgi:hypothetical protein